MVVLSGSQITGRVAAGACLDVCVFVNIRNKMERTKRSLYLRDVVDSQPHNTVIEQPLS